MRTFVNAVVSDYNRKHRQKVKFLVDTGSDNTVITDDIVRKLRLKIASREKVETANGIIILPVAEIRIYLEGREMITRAWVLPSKSQPVIGASTLETAGLSVDTKKGRLVKSNMIMY